MDKFKQEALATLSISARQSLALIAHRVYSPSKPRALMKSIATIVSIEEAESIIAELEKVGAVNQHQNAGVVLTSDVRQDSELFTAILDIGNPENRNRPKTKAKIGARNYEKPAGNASGDVALGLEDQKESSPEGVAGDVLQQEAAAETPVAEGTQDQTGTRSLVLSQVASLAERLNAPKAEPITDFELKTHLLEALSTSLSASEPELASTLSEINADLSKIQAQAA